MSFTTATTNNPKDSGNWIKGVHEPLITKELFDKTRKQLEVAPRAWGKKNFKFAEMLTCGSCGGMITGEDKVKKNNSGKDTRYVYYRCNNGRVGKCKEKYMREEEIQKQLVLLMDTIEIEKLAHLKEQMETEMKKYQAFAVGVLGEKSESVLMTDEKVRKYARSLVEGGRINTLIMKEKLLIISKGGIKCIK